MHDMNEDDVADVYVDYLGKQDDVYILAQLLQSYKLETEKGKPKIVSDLCDYERTQIISIIQNIDYTGKYDCGFEDLRKSIIR